MAKKASQFITNFSLGEVSTYIDARPDLAKRFNAARTVENWWLLQEGGATRRPGSKFGGEVKDSAKFHRLIPFEYSVDDAFVLIYGDENIRFIKNRAAIMSGLSPYEIVSPYDSNDLRDIHIEQSSDYLFMTSLRLDVDVQKLIRLADDNWVISNFAANPPPTFAADSDISGGTATLTPAATTGASVTFTASAAVFLEGDIGRSIIFGASRAIIATVDVGLSSVTASIVEAFPNTSAIPAGSWFLRGTPDGSFDPSTKAPVHTLTDCIISKNSFRVADVGRFIKVYGGTLKITSVPAANHIICEIMTVLSDSTTADPAAATAGSWRLEDVSWSAARGYPRTLVINGGRLVFFGWPANPTGFAGSNIDDIYNFATGSLADDAYIYTIQGGAQNPIQWAISHIALYLGDAKREYSAKGRGVDTPIGGAETPNVVPINFAGSMHVQPLVVDGAVVTLQRFGHDVVILSYSLEQSSDATNLIGSEPNLFSRHIGDMGFAVHLPAYAAKPFSIVFFPLNNGQLAGLTFKPRQEVSAFSRIVTQGDIESVAVVPHEDGRRLTVYQIVARTINGAVKRFWEYYEDDDSGLQTRISDGVKWSALQTDCAKVGAILAGAATITGITHLPNTVVDVIIGDNYIGEKTVSAGGVVTLDVNEVPAADTTYEVGLHYISTLATLRPTIPGEVTEGLKRDWPMVFVRVQDTIGGKINGKWLKKQQGGERMFTGLSKMDNLSTDDPYDGSLTITIDQPYPATILGVSGTVSFADTAA